MTNKEKPMASNSGTDPDVGTPRWVKAMGIIALIVLVAFVMLHLTGGRAGHHMAP